MFTVRFQAPCSVLRILSPRKWMETKIIISVLWCLDIRLIKTAELSVNTYWISRGSAPELWGNGGPGFLTGQRTPQWGPPLYSNELPWVLFVRNQISVRLTFTHFQLAPGATCSVTWRKCFPVAPKHPYSWDSGSKVPEDTRKQICQVPYLDVPWRDGFAPSNPCWESLILGSWLHWVFICC